jgi:hypothetical protein
MHFSFSFSTLLGSVLLALSAAPAHAAPYQRNVGTITLPVQRLHQVRSDVDAGVVRVTGTYFDIITPKKPFFTVT